MSIISPWYHLAYIVPRAYADSICSRKENDEAIPGIPGVATDRAPVPAAPRAGHAAIYWAAETTHHANDPKDVTMSIDRRTFTGSATTTTAPHFNVKLLLDTVRG